MAHASTPGRRRLSYIAGLALAGLLAAAAPALADDGQILRDGAPDAVPESYIVVFNEDAGQTSSAITALSREHKAKVRHKFLSSVKGFSAKMSREEALELAADPAVAYVEQDRTHAGARRRSPTRRRGAWTASTSATCR